MKKLVTTLTVAILVTTSAAARTNNGLEEMTKQKLREADATALIPVIACESGFRQYDENGKLLRNKTYPDVVGIMQLRQKFHPDPAVVREYNEKRGTDYSAEDFDLTVPEDNVDYGIIYYKVEGLWPWTQCLG